MLRSAGVEPLLAKGWAAGRLYPEPGLRPCGDIDLYVRPEQHAAALGALVGGAGGGVGLARSLVWPARDRGLADLTLLASGYLFVHTTVLLLQQCFPVLPLLSMERVVATALCAGQAVLAWRLTRNTGGSPARGGWSLLVLGCLLLPAGLVASYALALQVFDARVGVGLSLLVLPFAVLVLAARWLSQWQRGRAIGALLGIVLLLGSLVYATRPPGPGESAFLSDTRQPDPRGAAHGAPRPNIVLVVLDSLRARNVSCHGYPRQTTPNIDAFAREAVLYSNFLTPGNWSLPSHASLLTGLYPSSHGAHRLAMPEPGGPSRRPARSLEQDRGIGGHDRNSQTQS